MDEAHVQSSPEKFVANSSSSTSFKLFPAGFGTQRCNLFLIISWALKGFADKYCPIICNLLPTLEMLLVISWIKLIESTFILYFRKFWFHWRKCKDKKRKCINLLVESTSCSKKKCLLQIWKPTSTLSKIENFVKQLPVVLRDLDGLSV